MTEQESERDRLHRLVDVLPAGELFAARRFLEFLTWRADPVAAAVAASPSLMPLEEPAPAPVAPAPPVAPAAPFPVPPVPVLPRLMPRPEPAAKAAPAPVAPAPPPAPPSPLVLLASDPNTPADRLAELAGDADSAVREAVAGNPQAPQEVLDQLAMDPDAGVRLAVARSVYATADAHREAHQAHQAQLPPAKDVSHALALSLHHEGHYEEAVAEYLHYLEAKPLDAEARCRLADTYLQQGLQREAVAQFRKAASIDPQLLEPHARMAAMLLEQEDWAAAMAAFEQVLRLDRTNSQAVVGLNKARYRLKKG